VSTSPRGLSQPPARPSATLTKRSGRLSGKPGISRGGGFARSNARYEWPCGGVGEGQLSIGRSSCSSGGPLYHLVNTWERGATAKGFSRSNSGMLEPTPIVRWREFPSSPPGERGARAEFFGVCRDPLATRSLTASPSSSSRWNDACRRGAGWWELERENSSRPMSSPSTHPLRPSTAVTFLTAPGGLPPSSSRRSPVPSPPGGEVLQPHFFSDEVEMLLTTPIVPLAESRSSPAQDDRGFAIGRPA
jgi:hypothetical protein